MLNEIDGDLIKLSVANRFDVIAHGCNCFNTMGAGIARQIADAFPRARKADGKTVRGDRTKLGRYSVSEGKPIILNVYTQYLFGSDQLHVDYEAIREAFRVINSDYAGLELGIPKIGAGLAGGDWDKIRAIIEEVTPDLNVTVVNFNT